MKAARLLSVLLLLVTPAWCGTKLLMHNVTSPVVGYRYATSTQGQGMTTSTVNSVAGPTSGVQLTKTAGGPVLVWISPPLSAAATISGTATIYAWAKESSTACNCGLQVTVHKYSGGSEGTAFLNSERGTELTTAITNQNWTATPVSTSFAVGDRIVVKWWINDAGGTMASGKTVTTDYDGSTAGSDGDTWVQFNETLSFQPEPEIIQNKSAAVTTAGSVTVNLNPTGSNHLLAVVVAADYPTTIVTAVSDNAPGGSCNYVGVDNSVNAYQVQGGGLTDIWYCARSNPGATSLTVTTSPITGISLSAWVYEISGMKTNTPVDVSGVATDTQSHTNHVGVSLTTAGSPDFLVETDVGCGHPTAVTSPWTLDATPGGDASVYLTATGTYQPTFTFYCAGAGTMSGAAFLPVPPNQPPSVDAGPNQSITLPTNTVNLNGTVTDDGLPNNTVTISWTKVSGPGTVTFGNPSSAITSATFSVSGTYVLQLTANDSQLSASANVTVTVNPEPISLVLSPAVAGPDVTGTTQAMTAVLKIANAGTPISGASVQFTVTGPNATTGSSTTDSTGTAKFTYTGANSGNDTVQASYAGTTSNSSTVSWLVPGEPISTSPVLGLFFFSDGSSLFDTLPTAVPAFSEIFPNIGFNPLSGSIPGNISGIGPNSRPFTDVTTDTNGNFTGTIVAQGNGLQAGVGSLWQFQAVFTGSFTVATAGNQSIGLSADDTYILGIGGGATRVSGPMSGAPSSGVTPFTNLPVMGAGNFSLGNPNTVVVNFPAAGIYPYELDYDECCSGPLYMSMTLGQSNTIGFPPTGSLSLSPISPPSLAAGQSQTFTAAVTDASGAALQNAAVALVVNGANVRQLTATSDSTGHATFQYTGTNAGTDTVQATANISGLGEYSNVVNMAWTAILDGLVVNAGANQSITLPTNSVTLNGTVTESGVPTSAFAVSWSEVSGPGTVIFSNPNQAVTLATFTVAGTYDLRLTASDTVVARSSDVTITVNAQVVGNIEVCYYCSTTFGLGTFLDGPTFVIRNTSTSNMAGGVLRIGPAGGYTDSFNVGAIPAGGFVTVAPGLSNDGGGGHTFFRYLGGILDTSDNGPDGNDTQFEFTSLQGGFQVDSGVFTPAATYGPSLDGTTNLNFLGGPGNADLPCNNCFDKIVANLGISNMPVLIISKTHVGDFYQGEQNAPYNLTVANPANSVPTSSAVTVTETLPSGLSLVSMAGNGWSCTANNCSRGDSLASGASYPPITVTANVASNAASPQTNIATVSGGGAFINESTMDSTVVTLPGPQLIQVSPSSAQQGTQGLTVALVGQNTHFAQGTTTATFGSGITVVSLTVNSSTSATAVVNIASSAPPGVSNVTLTTSGEVASLAGGFGVISSGAIVFVPQGWIGSPSNGSVVQGQVPITVASGETLTSGTLTYWPTSNPAAIAPPLSSNTTGSGTLGTFDATLLASGGYTIQLNATDSNNNTQTSQITVSVMGNSKPGRMTSTVTEFKVPIAGIPMSITRTYDSLDRSKVEDFGYGWKLGTYVDLTVDAQSNVTFNFGGQRVTFFFTPQPLGFFGWWLVPAYTPQAGTHGSLISDGCGGLLRLQSGLVCFPSTGQTYQPTVYAYTDPIGRTYNVSASGQLQSIKDLNGNTLTVAPAGITSSVNGVVIPFVRDGQNRITKITDLNGNPYSYSYDASGNLQSVSYPGLTQSETYTYFTDHSLKNETDPRGNSSGATYYSDGRLQTITDTMQNTWSYSYNLSTNTTTTTNPPDGNGNVGTVVRTDDSFGKPLSITDPLNRTTTYTYDSNENLVSMVDPLQNPATTYTYDANGFQTSISDPLRHMSTKTYNQFGGVLTATDAANTNTVTTTYDANFNPKQVTDLLNGPGTPVSSSTYDALGDLLTSTDANGKTTEYAYDPQGNLAQVTDALNGITNFYYDPMGRLTSQKDALNNTTKFTYDALGRLKTKTDALLNQTIYAYDNNGNKTSETDARNNVTTYGYDNMNRVNLITYPTSPATTRQFTYDFRGNKLTEIDQSGRTTKYVYDLAGQLSSVTYAFGTPDAETVSYTYDLDGRQKTIKDELNNTTTNNYDAAGRMTSVHDATTNPATIYSYDADNRRTSVQDPNLNTTSYAYYPRNWLKTVTYPIVPPATQPTTTQYTYDGMGRVLTTTDQAGKVTTKNYDDVGRLKSVQDALQPPQLTQYFYDLNGNLKTITDANGHNTTFQYDTLNRRIMRTLPLQQFETMTYDAVGNLATKKDFNGKTTTYTYDPVNRLLKKIPDASLNQPTITFTYNPTGTRASMVDASGTTTYTTYDNRDRLKTKVTPEGTLNYTYDPHGNLLTLASSNTNGASMTYTYDVLNRLASAKDNRVAAQGGPSTPTTYSYDPAGNLSGYAYSNALQTGNIFDPLNRLTRTCVATTSPACSAGTKLASYAYTLGNAGNRTAVAELNGRNVGYGYDNDYRLSSEAITGDPAGNNGTVSYTNYDNVGNRTLVTSTLSAVPGGSFSYDANDRLTTDSYDANGNTTSSAGISSTYDFENRMLTHGAVTIVYDGDGNRVSETAGGTTTKYLVDSLNPSNLPQVLDEVVSGSVTRTYAYGLQLISENQLVGSTWTPSFYGYDGHGNVRFLTSTAGTATDAYQFDAFGMPIASSGTTSNSLLYSGERLDGSVGLYDLRARYYNQATGRFWARDPIEGYNSLPLTNPYLYASDDPVDMTDPTGLLTIAPPPPAPPPTQYYEIGGTETTLIIGIISFTAIAALPQLAETINCGFNWDATGVTSAVASNTPPVTGGPCLQKPKPKRTCQDTFRYLIPVAQLGYPYTSAFQAEQAARADARQKGYSIQLGAENEATDGPCGANQSQYQVGTHRDVYLTKKGKGRQGYGGDIVMCPCCDDSNGEPMPTRRWNFIP